jgi:hypothetical protein
MEQILIAVSPPAGYGTVINCCFPLLQDIKQILPIIAVSSFAGYEADIN